MRIQAKTNRIDLLLGGYLAIWMIANSLTLRVFPAMHSDEAWLAGLSRAYLAQGRVTVTEPFFDLFPRQPHAFKMLFHVLQAALIQLLGFDLQSVRWLSLGAALLALAGIYCGLIRVSGQRRLALGMTIALSLQPLFLVTAHLARQESLIVAVLVMTFFIAPKVQRFWQGIGLGLLLGISFLIHPNALFAAAIAGLILLKDTVAKRRSPHALLGTCIGLLGSGLGLLGISLAVSPNFLQNYAEFGANLNVTAAPGQRMANFGQYFLQIWRQDTGTYWLPDLKGLLAAIPVLTLLACVCLWAKRHDTNIMGQTAARLALENGLVGLAGFFLALLIIGRYSPLSIVFCLVPLTWLVYSLILQSQSGGLPKQVGRGLRFSRLIAGLLITVMIGSGLFTASRDWSPAVLQAWRSGQDPYQDYSAHLASLLPEQAVVLGNLSAGFVLQNQTAAFYDIRNLAYIGEGDLSGQHEPSVEAYLATRGITTVIWYEEYDYILRNPAWWVLYEIRPDRTADPANLQALKNLIEKRGVLLGSFVSAEYGTRVVRFQGDYPWTVSVYRLDPAANGETPLSP